MSIPLSLSCCLGDTVTVNVELRPAADYPLDVYYLMDHSFSFNNDLDSLKAQANGIGKENIVLSIIPPPPPNLAPDLGKVPPDQSRVT